MAQPATTTNFILRQLRTAGIIGETEEKLTQIYDDYKRDDAQYRVVCRSYLIDYYCAVLIDEKRVEQLGRKFAVFDTDTKLGDIEKAIKDSSTSGVAEHHKTMLQSYLDKKSLSCVRAKALGFSEAEAQCLTYIQDLEEFLAYVPESHFTVDVSFVGIINKEAYTEQKFNQLKSRSDLKFYLETDLPKHAVYSSLQLEEAKELVEYHSKIDDLKNNGGFAISFGNGRDGYKTTFTLLGQFIAAEWKITKVEMLYPMKSTALSGTIQASKTIISELINETDHNALKTIIENQTFPRTLFDYFNGTMLIALERGAQKLAIWTLASREDFHDIAIQTSLVAILKGQAHTYKDPEEAIKETKETKDSHTISFMRQSIYTTDLYHLLRYAIESNGRKQSEPLFTTFDFYTQKSGDRLYPAKIASVQNIKQLETTINKVQIRDMPSNPVIIINRFRTTLTTTGASKVYVFATLPDQSAPSDLLTIKIMKLIAYANRLRYPNVKTT